MRPDEHKKKKNTTYKKKHGITNSDKCSSSSAADNTHKNMNKGKGKDVHAKGNNSNEVSDRFSSKTSKQSALSDSSDSDSETEPVERKDYRRREVVSNWRKYDLEPDMDDAVTSRGEDFEKLLSMAGEAMSRFRFKDELEWEDDLSSGDGKTAECNGPDLLSLDLADLSTSMSCIPIHKLLNIDERLFPADQLESNMKSANEIRHLYEGLKKDSLCHVTNAVKDNSIEKIDKKQNAAKDNLKSNINHNVSFSDKGQLEQEVVKSGVSVSSSSTTSQNSLQQSQTKQSTSEMKKPAVQELNGGDTKLKHQQHPQKQQLVLEDDDLDQLLDMDTGGSEEIKGKEKSSSQSVNNESSRSKKDDKKEAEELEDWLDSILD